MPMTKHRRTRVRVFGRVAHTLSARTNLGAAPCKIRTLNLAGCGTHVSSYHSSLESISAMLPSKMFTRSKGLPPAHDNPVKRKLVSHPKDWPWSSWSHYARKERGLIAIDALEDTAPKRKSAP
jgi:hypothetical protein